MADLATDLCGCFSVHKIGQPLPCRLMLGRVEAGTARCDAAIRADAGHLGIDKARAPLRALRVMYKMPIGRRTIHGLILRHWGNDNSVLKVHLAQLVGCEHRRAHLVGGVACTTLEPLLGGLEPIWITQTQVFMADPL